MVNWLYKKPIFFNVFCVLGEQKKIKIFNKNEAGFAEAVLKNKRAERSWKNDEGKRVFLKLFLVTEEKRKKFQETTNRSLQTGAPAV